jgi:SAM-dependent methyltransferase
MPQTDAVFAGSIPAFYDRYLGPLLFEPYAADLGRRLADLRSGRVLETAAGTGIVTRMLIQTLPETVAIVATDLNQPMLDFAAAQPGSARVEWRKADARSLPFEKDSFDAVVCQFGVMFFPDSVWDRLEENELSQIVSDTVAELFPVDPPRFLARTPYAYFNIGIIHEELTEAGFSSTAAETLRQISCAASARDAVIGLCQGTPLRSEIEGRNPDRLSAATDAAASAVADRFGDGVVQAKMQAHVITATN